MKARARCSDPAVPLLEVERDDRQALVAVLLVELDQVLRLVMAVRAPGAGHDGQHDLALEVRVFAGDQLAVASGKLNVNFSLGSRAVVWVR